MIARLACALVLLGLLPMASARGMEFEVSAPKEGPAIIIGRGPIIEGDLVRLEHAVQEAHDEAPDRHKVLGLDSSGGSVDEAFRMAAVIEETGLWVSIMPGMRCYSACASILFFSGEYHSVSDEGVLGFHSCRLAHTPEADAPCNQDMATFAARIGLAYEVVLAITEHASPNQMVYLSAKEADCWGLTRHPNYRPPEHGRCIYNAVSQALDEAWWIKHPLAEP